MDLRLNDWFTNDMCKQRSGITSEPRELRRGYTYLILWSKASIATEPTRKPPEIRDSSKEKNKL